MTDDKTMIFQFFSQFELLILAKIFCAMILGGIIGLEREKQDKPAGLRTNMFVTGSATLFTCLAGPLTYYFSQSVQVDSIQSDPIRIIEACITGVAFLGAGTIIQKASRHKSQSVQGLTTAASLMLSAAIGIAVALNLFTIAIGTTLLTLTVLKTVGHFSHLLLKENREKS